MAVDRVHFGRREQGTDSARIGHQLLDDRQHCVYVVGTIRPGHIGQMIGFRFGDSRRERVGHHREDNRRVASTLDRTLQRLRRDREQQIGAIGQRAFDHAVQRSHVSLSVRHLEFIVTSLNHARLLQTVAQALLRLFNIRRVDVGQQSQLPDFAQWSGDDGCRAWCLGGGACLRSSFVVTARLIDHRVCLGKHLGRKGPRLTQALQRQSVCHQFGRRRFLDRQLGDLVP